MIRYLFSILLLTGFVSAVLADQPKAQVVRISIPGKGRILTLAEVEVISGGKNIAPFGKAAQSSESAGGKPERGIDGNKHPDYNKSGDSHRSGQKRK